MRELDTKYTKIVATVGPASRSYEGLTKLVKEGVDTFRLNFSHGTHEDHKSVIDRVVYLNDKYFGHTGILADLQGPKLRVGKVKEGTELVEGQEILFTNEECEGDASCVYMNYEKFASDVNVGEKVLINDGKLVLEVLETDGVGKVKLKVLFGGTLSSNKGVNLPDTKISLPALTDKDLVDLEFILTQPVNWIALSFVRSAQDIIDLRKKIDLVNHPARIIAKIEKPEGVANIDEILEQVDGIMIARGDLGVEVPIEKMPGIQKMIIKKCIAKAKPVIVATQMMESMVTNPSPTRAEVTDVANAVLDGADAVMLSQETAVGNHPHLVVEAMRKILIEAEQNYEVRNIHHRTSPDSSTFRSDIVCFNAALVSEQLEAAAIVGMTDSGYTAFTISSCRPKSKIYIFSHNSSILGTLNLVWGVRCFYYGKMTTTDETFDDLNRYLLTKGLVHKQDLVINTGSMPIMKRNRTNMFKVTEI